MRKYRIKKTTSSDGISWYKVEYQRKMFFLFGPLIWVNAGSFDDGYYGTDNFFDYEDAEDFMKSLYTSPTVKIVKGVVVQ